MSGAGAMGVVYCGYDPELDRDVAIKLVRADARSSDEARLLREAQAMAQLRHPNVVPIFDVGPAPGGVFLAMPLLDGGTLRQWFDRERPSLDAILDKYAAAGRGLAAAHSVGIVHRDFKPDNVLLDADGEVFVADFGLAQLTARSDAAHPNLSLANVGLVHADTLTQSGQIMGTPAYMSPEQLRGRHVDARTDQFSFCVALWEAVYGQRPFRDPTDRSAGLFPALLAAIDAGPILPARGDRPRWLASLLIRGLAVDPDRRWPTLHALLDEIATRRASTTRPWRFAGPRMIGLVGVGIVVATVAPAHLVQPEAPPRFHLAPVMSGSDPRAAGLSPDGRQLAMVVGDTLVIRGLEPQGPDRVILDHDVFARPPTWSPDGKRVLASVVPDLVGPSQAVVVDIDSGARFKVPRPGMATFVSNDEIALTSFRDRSIKFISVGERVAAPTTCDVDGDYTLIRNLAGMPDGTTIVETLKGDTHALVVLRRDCEVRARFSAEPISSFAVSDTGTIIALTGGDGLRELLELSLDGEMLSRHRISGDLDTVLGRRHGVDYVATSVQKTHLDRVDLGGSTRQLHSVEGGASFSLAPDGDTLAWVELSGHTRARGRLRRSSLRSGLRDAQTLRDNALMVGWSPGGERLAVLVDSGRGPAVVVTDRNGRELRQVPLRHLARDAAPVWLDDHRILAASEDYLTYQWFDLNTGAQGDVMDTRHGGTYWLARSPRDGTLAMWRNGPPELRGTRTEHLWLQPLDGQPIPLPVDDAMRHYLSPSWSPSGELFVRALETGVVSRVALATGQLTPVARLPEMPRNHPFDSRLMFPADGDLLAVEVELGLNLWATVPDEELKALAPAESSLNL